MCDGLRSVVKGEIAILDKDDVNDALYVAEEFIRFADGMISEQELRPLDSF